MTIKYQKTDRQFILNALNPGKFRKNKPKYAPNKFSYFRTSDDHIHFGITHKLGSCERPDLATLNGTMIENLEKKYMFCSVSSSQDKKTGLDVVLAKDRWNECDGCRKILWKETKDGFREINFRVVSDKKGCQALCIPCFNKNWRVKNGNFERRKQNGKKNRN